ncbi:hypothetical protein D3C80_1772120 [compost metagenome]
MTVRGSFVAFRYSAMNSFIGPRSGPAISVMEFIGWPTATFAIASATLSAAMGWNAPVGARTIEPSVADCAIAPTNSKNWVA